MEKQLLKDAASCAIEFTKKYSGKDAKTKRYQALKSLADMTVADLKDGKKDYCKEKMSLAYLSRQYRMWELQRYDWKVN